MLLVLALSAALPGSSAAWNQGSVTDAAKATLAPGPVTPRITGCSVSGGVATISWSVSGDTTGIVGYRIYAWEQADGGVSTWYDVNSPTATSQSMAWAESDPAAWGSYAFGYRGFGWSVRSLYATTGGAGVTTRRNGQRQAWPAHSGNVRKPPTWAGNTHTCNYPFSYGSGYDSSDWDPNDPYWNVWTAWEANHQTD
ncbi:hypothetical protein E8D34_16930 [Nocardioides sp. GY 10113]|uniref:hypothetical protein n=1 Tax=Nocardioides sp. GY 10113 TaxID=2569761 RepID=UPI0010A88187|nr:hypothetical protein [Nocardioides sp. GY 10113]TIC82501.1 hypothetical protein E8D34_16930 [Nocardioides sp. GY 10113]